MGFILYLIVGGIIGWLAGLILGKDVPGGVIGNIIAGIIGAWLGGLIFPDFGPIIADIAIIPALLGAIVLILIVSFVMKSMNKKR
ncbi:transglycosylase associated family protein [Exiguobacterium sp. S17]|nr:transglycosylase associated family protein [Exiguobacterium sp. S17]